MIWKTEFPDNMGASSGISLQGDKLYLINFGCGNMGRGKVGVGKAFVACYNSKNGEQIFFNVLGDDKEPVLDYQWYDNYNVAYLVFEDRLTRVKLKDDQCLVDSWNMGIFGKLSGFVGCLFFKPSGGYINTTVTPDSCYIYNDKNECFTLDFNLGRITRVPLDNLFLGMTFWKSFAFASLREKGNPLIVFDKEGNRVADLKLRQIEKIIQNRMYIVKGEHLFEIDLKQLLDQ